MNMKCIRISELKSAGLVASFDKESRCFRIHVAVDFKWLDRSDICLAAYDQRIIYLLVTVTQPPLTWNTSSEDTLDAFRRGPVMKHGGSARRDESHSLCSPNISSSSVHLLTGYDVIEPLCPSNISELQLRIPRGNSECSGLSRILNTIYYFLLLEVVSC